MADEQRPAPGADATAEADPTDRPIRRPSPAASAASRARRIGGTARPTRAEKEAGVLPPPPSGPPRARSAGATASADGAGGTDGADDGASDAPDGIDASDGTDTGRRNAGPAWLSWAPAAVLVAGALAMAVLIAVVSHGVWWGNDAPSQRSVTALRQQVLAAAKTCVVRTNSYKYTDLDTFEHDGAACTTGAQTAQFRKAVDTLIRKNAPKLKFTQAAQINKAGIESVSGNQWTVLVYGQLQVSNVNSPSGRTDPFGAIVRMDRVGGKWLIASLRTVSSPVN